MDPGRSSSRYGGGACGGSGGVSTSALASHLARAAAMKVSIGGFLVDGTAYSA